MQVRNRTWINRLSVAAMLIGGAQVGSAAGASAIAENARRGSAVQHPAASSAKAARLREDTRKLWSDHGIWTREQHIMIAVDLIAAAKANDQAKYTATDQRWKKNGKQTADFLSQANPN